MSSPDENEATPPGREPVRNDPGESGRRRRTNALVVAVVAAVLVAGWAVLTVMQSNAGREPAAVDTDAPIEGLREYPQQSQNHVETPVDYPQTPPVGGDHLPVWQNCGFYSTPIQAGAGVHSLEHGAVWLGYDPDLPAEEIDRLRGLADVAPYLLVSPVEGLASPLVASAWGVQLALDGIEDERLQLFLVRYVQGEQTPEPGAPCTGGLT